MKVSNKILLEEFVQKFAGTKTPVNKWLEVMEGNNMGTHNELKAFFPSVDYVGNSRYVFNIKGNRYRFVVLIVFSNNIAQIRFCGTHAAYNKIKSIKNL